MTIWILVYLMLVLSLAAIAIYEHINTTSLSLPVSPVLTIVAILIPIFANINAFYYLQLTRTSNSNSNHSSASQGLLPAALQILQFAVTTIIGTIFFSNLLPTDSRACLLSTRWQRMWTDHDGDAIRRIQDAFNCCGFNSIKDRSWPFPRKGSQGNCAAQWGRTTPCVGPWTAALQKGSGAEFGVVAAVGLLQLLGLLVSRWLRTHQGASLFSVFKGSVSPTARGPTRPLLHGSETHGRGYEENVSHDGGQRDRRQSGRRQGSGNGYGSTGPRVEPAHNSPWEDEGEDV